MELLQLKYFVTVARMLNISRAAGYHRIPQPAMSKTISKLENELGARLFIRQKNRIMLTDEGSRFYQSVSHALSEIDEARIKVQKADDIPHGEISLLVREHRACVIKCIARFKKQYPDVKFKVFYEEKASGHCDFCIASDPAGREFDKSILLSSERMCLIVSAGSRLAEKTSVTVDDLREEEFAAVHTGSYQWKCMNEQCGKAGFVPKLTAEFGDIQCLAEYVELGMAVTLGPKSSYAGYGRKLAYLDFVPEISRPVFLYWNSAGSTKTTELFKENMIRFFPVELGSFAGGTGV